MFDNLLDSKSSDFTSMETHKPFINIDSENKIKQQKFKYLFI
jgi:hypothetical protein